MNPSDRNPVPPQAATFDEDVTGIGALADPVRRKLYGYVCAQPEPVGRDAAAQALGIPRHKVKFHLDRLEADGLLTADFVRLTGRTGPGAGRPAKVYRRADREIAVSLPQRQYELAGRIMADAIDESMRSAVPISEALSSTAAAHGRAIGAGTRGERSLDAVIAVLAEHGYEPRREPGQVVMANCPFHSLMRAHADLVCTMNHALITGIADSLAPGGVCACLDPGENRCCVTLRDQGTHDGASPAEARDS